jgi:hypothetical protein
MALPAIIAAAAPVVGRAVGTYVLTLGTTVATFVAVGAGLEAMSRRSERKRKEQEMVELVATQAGYIAGLKEELFTLQNELRAERGNPARGYAEMARQPRAA